MDEKLIELAQKARTFAYAPYSGFYVGAALLCKSGKIYTGCNVESASYSLTNCAERTAFFKAISEGEKDFISIAVVGGKKEATVLNYCYPCGACLQIMQEFCNPEQFYILILNADKIQRYLLKELLPFGFGKQHLSARREEKI